MLTGAGLHGGATLPIRCPILFERADDLERLDRCLARVLRGEGALAVLEGEAGSGKSALLGALRERASDAGLLVRSARAGELEQGFAYGIARQLLEPVLAAAGDERRKALTKGAAQHAAVVLEAVPSASADADDLRAHHGLHWLVANLADEQPVALLVDDAHWADAPSLRWLAYLVRRAHELPVLVALTTRPERPTEAGAGLDELADDPLAERVRPRPLSEAGAAELIARATGRAPAPAFAAAATRLTGGNPFYLRELVTEAGERGLEPDARGARRLPELGPERVGRSVWRRVRRAGPDAAAVASALAVLDGAAPPGLVASVAQRPAAAVLGAADQLARAGVVTVGPQLEYVHPIVRAAVAEHLGIAERAELHVRAATGLAAEGAEPGRVAVHLLRLAPKTALPGPDALAILRDAAHAAAARGAPRAAVALLRRALEEDPPPGPRRELGLMLARAELQLRDPRAFARYQELMDDAPDAQEAAVIGFELASRLSLSGAFADGAAVAGRLLAAGGAAPAIRRLLEAEHAGSRLLVAPQAAGARTAVAALRDRLDAGEDLHPAEIGVVAHAAGLFGEPRAHAAARTAVALEDPRVAEIEHSGLLGAMVHGLLLAEDRAALEPFFTAVVERAHASSDRTRLIWGHALRAQLRLSQGDAAAAEADSEAALTFLPDDDLASAVTWVVAVGTLVLTARGRAPEALELLERRAPPPPWPPMYQFGMLDLARASALLHAGDPAAALDACLRAPERLEGADYAPEALPWRSTAALCRRALGDVAAAQILAAEEVGLARGAGGGRALGRALVAEALCAPGAEQPARLREAVVVLESSDAAGELARARVELGAALRRAGRREDAREELRAGLDAASMLGAVTLVARARTELAAAGARPRRERLGGVAALTAAERRVVELAAEGSTNREIAQSLFLTQKTVETHLSSAYRKLGISSRSKLAATLAASG